MRVNGSLLSKCINKRVSIIGNVQLVHPSNMSFNMLSTDSVNVTVNLLKPIGNNLTGLVEVHGVVQSPSTISSDNYFIFPYNLANSYDAAMDNAAVSLMFSIPNAWN